MSGGVKASLSLAACLCGCLSSPPSGEQSTPLAAPPRAGFEPVSAMLGARCGSLDCHGHPARNLRLYGLDGLRRAPADVPGRGDGTTAAEHDANYDAVITLEPELLDALVSDHGENPTRLTLVRKARNLEVHEGGAAAPTGSDADRCLVSWLGLSVDVAACERDATLLRPVRR